MWLFPSLLQVAAALRHGVGQLLRGAPSPADRARLALSLLHQTPGDLRCTLAQAGPLAGGWDFSCRILAARPLPITRERMHSVLYSAVLRLHARGSHSGGVVLHPLPLAAGRLRLPPAALRPAR